MEFLIRMVRKRKKPKCDYDYVCELNLYRKSEQHISVKVEESRSNNQAPLRGSF